MTAIALPPLDEVPADTRRRADRSHQRVRLGGVVAVAIPTGVLGLHGLAYGHWIVDDAGITFAYARSVSEGLGPVLQPGVAPVEGYSNPAWLALLALGRLLGLFDQGAWFGVPDYVAFPKLLALLCCAGMFAYLYAAARALSSRPGIVAALAGSAAAAVPAFAIWVFSGLENSLLALVAVALAATLARAEAVGRLLTVRVAVACGLIAALAALTRPDGLIYAGAFPLAALVSPHRRRPLATVRAVVVSVAAFAVPAGCYLGWRVATFGEVLPNTALAKSQGLPGVDHVLRLGELVQYAGWPTVLIAVAVIGAALVRPSRPRPGLIGWLVPTLLAIGAFVVLEPDWMGQFRFTTPVWPLAAFAATVSLVHVLSGLRLGGRCRTSLTATIIVATRVATTVATVVAVALSGLTLHGQLRAFRAEPTAPLCLVAQNAGRNMAGYAAVLGRPDASALLPDVGGAALASPLRIVDLAGLTDARMAAFWRSSDWAGLRDYVFDQARPTFAKTHQPWGTITGLLDDPRMSRDYVAIMSTAGTTDWVRRDAVTAPGSLLALRHFALHTAIPRDNAQRAAPRSSCGDRLTP